MAVLGARVLGRWRKPVSLLRSAFVYITPLLVFIFAFSYLRRASEQTSVDEILRLTRALPLSAIAIAFLATAGSFCVAAASEILAFRSSETSMRWRRIAKVSFVSFGVSNILSLAGLAGTSLRLRLYFRDNVPPATILRVTAFAAAGLWVGFFVLLGLLILLQPLVLPSDISIAPWCFNAIAAVTLVGSILYLALAWAQKPVLRIFNQQWTVPRLSFALAQMGLAMLDWSVAALALYILLPAIDGVNFFRFLHVFLIAQIIGAITAIPGSLGILEVLTVYLLLRNHTVPAEITAALVLYRFIYYLMPFILALTVLAVEEVVVSTHMAARAFRGVIRVLANWVPLAAAGSTVAIGLSFLIEGNALSLLPTRALAADSPPFVSVLLLSIYGIFVLVLADGLRRRSFAAWAFTLPTLFWTTVLMVITRCSLGVIAFGIGVLGILIFSRTEFFRRSRLFDDVLSLKWSFYVGLMAGAGGLLYWQVSHDLSLAHRVWWDSLTLGPVTGVASLSFWRLIIPNGQVSRRQPYITLPDERLGPLAKASPHTQSQLALLGDKEIFPNCDNTGFIMFSVEGKSWVCLGDPVAQPRAQKALIQDFYRFVDKCGGVPVFYQIHPAHLGHYVDLGYQLLKIGEEGRVYLPSFTLDRREHKSMRNTCNRMAKEQITFEILPQAQVAESWSDLKRVSDSWIKAAQIKEKGFSLGFFDRKYLSHFDFAVLRRQGEIVAFANLWKSDDKSELSVDLMRTGEGSLSGSMEFLFIRIMEWGQTQGFQWFNLGMAPLSGLDAGQTAARTWNQFGSMIYDSGESFYNFKGVRAFKDKFSPVWDSRYLAYPHSFAFPTVLTDVARLISRGGVKQRKG